MPEKTSRIISLWGISVPRGKREKAQAASELGGILLDRGVRKTIVTRHVSHELRHALAHNGSGSFVYSIDINRGCLRTGYTPDDGDNLSPEEKLKICEAPGADMGKSDLKEAQKLRKLLRKQKKR